MRKVKCKSGLMGWREKLQKNYEHYREFLEYDELYGIAKRLGFKSALQAWESNPLIEGSAEPSDLRIVSA